MRQNQHVTYLLHVMHAKNTRISAHLIIKSCKCALVRYFPITCSLPELQSLSYMIVYPYRNNHICIMYTYMYTLIYTHIWDRHCGQRLRRAMNWVDRLRTSADERVLSGRRAVVMVWWAAAGFSCSSLTFHFSWTVTLVILGLGILHARLLGFCCTARPRLLRSANCSGVYWEEGMGGWVVLVSQEVGTIKS